jgi:hypothetical protein
MSGLKNLVPGGIGSLGLLGAAFGGFMVNEFVDDVASLFNM